MIVIVCGGRHYLDRATVFSELDRIDAEICIEGLIEGGQRTFDDDGKCVGGADYHADRWAYARGILRATEKADWKRWGRAAGPIRNKRMLDKWKPGAVIHFPGGSGTDDMIEQARLAGVRRIRAGVRLVAAAA